MKRPANYEWKDVEKAVQGLALKLDEVAARSKSADKKAMGANLAAVLRQQAKDFGEALVQHNDIVATEKANLEQLIQQAMDDQQKAMAAAQKEYAAQPLPPMTSEAAPLDLEDDPGPRLRREFLDRYGKRETSKPGDKPAGFDTWLQSSQLAAGESAADSSAGQPTTPAAPERPRDELEQAWMPFFGAGSPPEPAPKRELPPTPPPAPKRPAGPEKSSRGWATWMDESSGGGSVNT